MKELFKNYLFDKYILVNDTKEKSQDIFELIFAIANMFNIRLVSGKELVTKDMISYIAVRFGENVPEPFYRGFPESVRQLTKEELLYDQLLHYSKTYGFGDFSEAGHSVFEEDFERAAFTEPSKIREFVILTEEEAIMKLSGYAKDLLNSTRPLSGNQFNFVSEFIRTYHYKVKKCASKNTAVRLLIALRDLYYTSFLTMSDVIKLVDEMNVQLYGKENIKKLNLKNADRKFITAVINKLFREGNCDIKTCCEKKAVWNGLLHHIHYHPVDDASRRFVSAMRGRKNLSIYSEFERAMKEGEIKNAVRILKEGKGSGAILRNLEYILSRTERDEDISYVINQISADNGIVLLQLLMKYSKVYKEDHRTFVFTRHNRLCIHGETDEEVLKRKSCLTPEEEKLILGKVKKSLKELYGKKLGTVYVDKKMKKIALPIQENTSSSGLGVLPKGSRVEIEKDISGKKKIIRAFTYWEKIDDIDLSLQGISKDGTVKEFSWRTMYDHRSDIITFSGDETSGYRGGSEYFDINIDLLKKKWPDIQYLLFCNNVFSGEKFSDGFCKAGYMLRSADGSGQVFEPKTVKTSFLIDGNSTFSYLFALDLRAEEMIWLNLSRQGRILVAGDTSFDFLYDYFAITDVMNVYDFMIMLASEITDDPLRADWIVTDENIKGKEGAEFIRSCDAEKIHALINC